VPQSRPVRPAQPPSPARKRLGYILAGAGVLLALAAVYLLFLKGGKTLREVFPVEGRVTFKDGSAVTGGEVVFFELAGDEPSEDNKRVRATGTIQRDGSYRMGTYQPNDGVPEGRYKVLVVPPRPPNIEQPPAVWPPFNRRYAQYKETPLEYAVTRGDNRYDIAVAR
jgi:hypothetical protein